MADDASEIAHVLIIGLVGNAPLDQLDEIVRRGTRFRVTDAAGKLRQLRTNEEIALVFFKSDPEAALECAVETAAELRTHPELNARMAIHSGSASRDVDLSAPLLEHTRQIMLCGDAGHILLSKRCALELAPMPRWNTHLYEIGHAALRDDEKISLVNFHADWAGNVQEPSRFKQAHAATERRRKLNSLGRKLAAAATLLSILAIAAGLYLYAKGRLHIEPPWSAPPPDKSIAVLPLGDLSAEREQEFFSSGLTDEILDALAQMDGLRVIARDSSFAFKDKNADVREVGRKLNVATVLEGTLQQDAGKIRLTTQLFNALNGSQIWSGTINKESQDVAALPDEIAKDVARALRIKIASVPAVQRKIDMQARDFFLPGLFFAHKRDEEDLRHSIELFQLALTKEPRLDRAWSGIARDWISLGESHVKPLDAYPRAENAATKALAINDGDAEAHAFLGETRRVLKWDGRGAEAELKRALELKPSFAVGHTLMSILQAARGNGRGQIEELATAAQLDPLSPMIASEQVSAFVANDRLDDAFNAAKRTMEIDPDYIYFEPALALVYREQGKLKEALEIYERLEQTRRQNTAGLAITYARLGRKDDARRVVSQLIDRANQYYFPGEQIAAIYVALGDYEEAFRWINRAIEEHSPTLSAIAFAPEFRVLRTDPRFAETLRRIGIDAAKSPQDRQ